MNFKSTSVIRSIDEKQVIINKVILNKNREAREMFLI